MLLLGLFLLCLAAVHAQSPEDYYSSIDPASTPAQFYQNLHALLSSTHKPISYEEVWQGFQTTDYNWHNCPQRIRDIYSTQCWAPGGAGQCGSYKREGDCYNREHSWPKSWWNDHSSPAYSDLHHLYPSDGYVNNRRANMPVGQVTNPTYVSSGGKIGHCNSAKLTTVIECFEPADWFKGEIARTYFYMSTRYYNAWTCCDTEGTDKWNIKPWMEETLRKWHLEFPVTEDERLRNQHVFEIQGNRNPFVDHPEWVSKIADF